MDFHAWFEVPDGQWYTFDARHNVPRIGRVFFGAGCRGCGLDFIVRTKQLGKLQSLGK